MADIQDLRTALSAAEAWIDDLASFSAGTIATKSMLPCLQHCTRCAMRCRATKPSISARELPPLLRGLYYDGWHPAGTTRGKRRGVFLERIHDGAQREPGIDPEQVARAVFALLAARLLPAKIEGAKALTPKELRSLWPT